MRRRKGKAKFLRGVVFELVKNSVNGTQPDGATNDEMQVVTRENSQTLSPRTRELVKMGLVTNSGKTRPTRKERPAIVWIPGAGAIIDGQPNKRVRPPTKAELKIVSKLLESVEFDMTTPSDVKLLWAFMKWVKWLAST